MRKETRELIAYAESIGFQNQGLDGRGHYRLRHRNGAMSVSATPGDVRSQLNERARLRQIAGVKSDSPNAGHSRFVRGSGYRPQQSRAEQTRGVEVKAQRALLDSLDDRIRDSVAALHASGSSDDYRAARELLRLAGERQGVAQWLTDHFQPVPKCPIPSIEH